MCEEGAKLKDDGKKLRLDLVGGAPGDDKKGSKHGEVMENLRKLTMARWPVSKWVEAYCEHTLDNQTAIECARRIVRAQESYTSSEFFSSHLSKPDASIYDVKGFYWPLPLIHILAWVLVMVTVAKGPEWMGKVVYVTAIFPVVMMVVILIFSLTLDGHQEGVAFYTRTNFCKMKDPHLWLNALGQSFFSLSIGCGGLMTLSS